MRRAQINTLDTPKPRLSIRTRLMVLTLVAVVPLMLDRVRVLENTRQERIEVAYADVAGLARRAAEQQLEIINLTKTLLQTVARSYVALDHTVDSCNDLLAKVSADVPWFRGMSVVGSSGRVICSSRAVVMGLDLADREYVQKARARRDFVVSGYLMHRADGQPAIIAAYPVAPKVAIKDAGGDAIIVASVDLQWIGRLDRMIGQHTGAAAYLIDHDGAVLASSENGASEIDAAHQDFLKTIVANEQGTVVTAGFGGHRRIFAYERLPLTEARIVIGLDEHDILSRIDREISIAYLQLALFGSLALLVVWVGGERLIVRPIRSLAKTAGEIGRGDMTVHATTEKWAAEFAPLAAALADMALKLSAREHDLRATNLHLEELASIDELSRLANRRAFDAKLKEEWRRAIDQEQPVGLLMIDADHFKLFNDSYGHPEGDRCLRMLGNILIATAAENGGFAARYGGEEFVLLLPGAEWDKAMHLAGHLRARIADLQIVNVQAPARIMTVSIGVASVLPHEGDQFETLVEAADAGLYAAKRRGRNTIASAASLALTKAG